MTFISQAWAQDVAEVAGSGEASIFIQLAPLLIVFAIFYMIVIRPQSKKLKKHHEMLDALQKGDKVITGGGILAKVKKVNDQEVTVEIAKGVGVVVTKSSLMSKVEK